MLSKHAGTWFAYKNKLLVKREGDSPDGKILLYQDADGKTFKEAPKVKRAKPAPKQED